MANEPRAFYFVRWDENDEPDILAIVKANTKKQFLHFCLQYIILLGELLKSSDEEPSEFAHYDLRYLLKEYGYSEN